MGHPCGETRQIRFLNLDNCLANNCEATTCSACLGLVSKCLWTPQLKWNVDAFVFVSKTPYDYKWNCWGNLMDQDSLNLTVMIKTSDTCPQLCAAHRTCSTCLSSHGESDLVPHFSGTFRHDSLLQRSSLDLSNNLSSDTKAGSTAIASSSLSNTENSNTAYGIIV